jgi:alanine racemase
VSFLKRCWAEIDLGALRHNAQLVRKQVGLKAKIMAIVKANAYGHGYEKIAQALLGAASKKPLEACADLEPVVEMFGVANLREALQLSEFAVPSQIFILGAALPFEREEIVRQGFISAISSLEEALAFDEISRRIAPQGHPVHLVVDSGMGRMGAYKEESIELARDVLAQTTLRVTGIATHLPVPDEDEDYTQAELEGFEVVVGQMERAGVGEPLVHSLNSAGVIRFSEHACGMVRVGLMLYGSSPIPGFQDKLRPVMALKTRLTLVREVPAGRSVSYGRTFITDRTMRVATLAIGYADGYQRALSNQDTEVLVAGKRCKVLGRVTMDQIMVDVTEVPGASCGDEAVLIGAQLQETIFAEELARRAKTIPWEIFTGIKNRVERVYI